MFASLQSSIFQAAFCKSKIKEAWRARGGRTGRPRRSRRCLRWEVPQIDSLRFFWTNIHPWNRCIFAEILWDNMKYLQSSHPLTKNLSGLRKGPQLCPLRRKGGLPRRWTVYPLFFLPVQKCVFKSSPAHWLISCFSGRDKGRTCLGREGEGEGRESEGLRGQEVNLLQIQRLLWLLFC